MRTKYILFLQEIVDNLVAVLAEVGEDEADVHPVCAFRIVFPYQLIKRQMVLDIIEPPLALLQIAVDTKVSRLAFQVLAVIHTTNGFIELLTAEATAYLDRFVHCHP